MLKNKPKRFDIFSGENTLKYLEQFRNPTEREILGDDWDIFEAQLIRSIKYYELESPYWLNEKGNLTSKTDETLEKARIYVQTDKGERPPRGVTLERGPKEGTFYESSEGNKKRERQLRLIPRLESEKDELDKVSLEDGKQKSLKSPIVGLLDNLDSGISVSLIVELENGKRGIFKPSEGESNWDDSIPLKESYKREVASYIISKFLGFDFCPPTTITENKLGRKKNEMGAGSIQEFIPKSKKIKWGRTNEFLDQIQNIVFFDLVIGNLDRHDGNVLLKENKIYAIDHGFCFPIKKQIPFNYDFLSQIDQEEIPKKLIEKLQSIDKNEMKRILSFLLEKEAIDLLLKRIDCILLLKKFTREVYHRDC